MVAVFTGLGAGFERGSGAALGGMGLLGSSSLGRAGESAFLNAATGNLVLTRQDEFLAGRGPDVALARTYNSQGALDDANNDDWRQSLDRRLINLVGTENTSGSKITRVSADGSEIEFTYNTSAGSYISTEGAGAHDKLSYASGVWTWEEGSSHLKETYAAAETGVWRITSVVDVDGNALTFTYLSGDPTRLDKVTTADGGYVQYTWLSGNLTKVETKYASVAGGTVDRTLTRVYYGYDGQNRLTSVTVDLSPDNNSTSDSKVYTLSYTYDGTSNRIASISQSDGSALAISYTNVSGVYKVSRLVQTVATGETRTTDIVYSTATIGAETFDVAEMRVYRDATLSGYIATTVKSVAGQLREVVQAPAQSGQSAQTFSYEYDPSGNVLSIIDTTAERSRRTDYTYDSSGNATQIIVTLNGASTPEKTTTRSYVNNNLVEETVIGSNAASGAASLSSRYVYDSENHLRFTISAEGRVSEFEYTTNGELTRTIVYKAGLYTTAGQPSEATMDAWGNGNAANAEVKTYEYDGRGGLLRAYAFSATASFVESTADGRSRINTVYDQSGALLSRFVEGQASETFVYDGLGRLIASTDLSGGITHFHFVDDGSGAQTVVTTRAAFNSGANDWDPTSESLITTQTFNRAGELTASSQSVGAGGATTTVGTKTFAYDKLGRLRWTADATTAARKSYFLYDDLGHKTADIGHDGQLTEYRYDATGRLVATIHYATAISVTTLANAANAVVIADVRPSYSASDIVQWSIYDANDRIVQTIQGDGAVTAYEYDKLGRLVTTKGYFNRVSVTGYSAAPPTSPVSVAAHAKDFIVRSFYDGDGLLIGSLNGEGYLTQHVYDAAGRKIQDIGYANATAAGNRVSGSFNTLKTSLANGSADRNVRYVYDGQGFLRFTIDALSQVTEARYWDGPNASPSLAARQQATGLVRETLVYNVALGSLGAYDYATVKSAVAGLSGAAPRITRFVYDDKAQLAYTIDASGAVSRNWYDASGRLTKSAAFSTLYTTAFSADASTWKATLDAWSPSGDQTRITRNYYNVRNELSFSIDAEGYATGFSYDAEGRVTSESRYSTKLTTVDDTWTWSSVNGASKGTARTTTTAYDNLGRVQYVQDVAGRFTYNTYYVNGAQAGKIEGTWANQARTYFYYDQAGKLTRESRTTDHSGFAGSLGAAATQLTTASGLQQIVSANSQYRALLEANGELVLSHYGEAIWRSGTAENVAGATYRLTAQTDGNLVIYRIVGATETAIWNSNTAGVYSGATFIAISNTGELTLNKGTAPTSTGVIWSSGTNNVTAQNPYAAFWLDTYYAYDGFGNVVQTTAPNGQVTTMAYDKAARLLSRTSVVGPQAITQSFEYSAFESVKATDALGNASYVYFDQLGRLQWSVDGEGYVNQTTYNSFGEVAANVRYRQRATNTPSTTMLPALAAGDTGLVTSYVYDNLGRVAYVIDAENYVTGTAYNAFGQTLSVTRYANTTATLGPPALNPAADATTEFQYDLLGRVTRNEDALDVAELYGYDAYDRTSVTNRLSGVTTNLYDGSGLLVQETISAGGGVTIVNKYEYDARGNLAKKLEGWNSTSSTALRTTRYEYDKLDRLIAIYHDVRDVVTSADLATTSVTPTERYYYDKAGNLAGQLDRAGGRTFYWYDGAGRLTHKLAPNGALTGYSYDANGNLTQQIAYATALTPPASVAATPPLPTTNALDRTTEYVYDKLGRALELKTLNVRAASHNGAALSVDSSAQTVSVKYDYDAANNVVRTTDANGAQTYAYFDKLGRKLSQIDVANYRTDWTFDANGNVLSERRYAQSVATASSAPSVNIMRGGDLTAGANVLVPYWTVAGGAYVNTIETIDGAPALALRKTGGEIFSWSAPSHVWGGSATAMGDAANGRFAVSGGEQFAIAAEVKQLAAGAISVSGEIQFYSAAGVFLGNVWNAVGADAWERMTLSGRVPEGATHAVVNFGSFRTDGLSSGGLDFGIRKMQVHKLAAGAAIPGWTVPGASLDDRITTFSYDRLGRRTSERRSRVAVDNGAGASTVQDSVITYAYNGLGLVLTKTEASGDTISYGYDVAGRLTSEQRNSYVDFEGATVSPRVEYAYNALNDLLETRQRGKVSGDDRVTTYVYGAGGLLASKTDAAGFKRSYVYDAAGRLRREEYNRLDFAANAIATEAVGYDYDTEGRLTQQGALVRPSGSTTTWTRSKIVGGLETVDTLMMRYNAFGEVYERGFNNLFTEKMAYDAAGRLWRTNSGDGAFKYFMYDKAGNQTLAFASVGADLDNKTLEQVLVLWDNPATSGVVDYDRIATTNVAGIVATITRYDGRNQAILVLEPQRELTAATSADLRSSRLYNAFGEVVRETNANGHDANGDAIATASIDYVYNTMGRLIQTTSPAVSITGENGAVTSNYRPIEYRYYDRAGRLVADRDANGNLTRYTLLAGSGYGGSQTLITETITPDGAVTRTKYDIHGDARLVQDQLYSVGSPTLHVITQTFDKLGRLIEMNKRASTTQALTDYYAYDGLGQRIKHWNSFYNANGAATNNVEQTAYDHQGRVTQVIAAGGDTTKYGYGWDATLLTTGMNSTDGVTGNPFGGWVKTTIFANGKTLTQKSDMFGHQVREIDLGGHTTYFSYDKAGRLSQTNATQLVNNIVTPFGAALYQSYFNTGRLKETHRNTGTSLLEDRNGNYYSSSYAMSFRESKFGYDKLGQVVSQTLRETGYYYWETPGHYDGEGYWEPGESGADPYDTLISNQTATYDALGRITGWSETGSSELGPATHNFEYDANGNIRRSLATYRQITAGAGWSTTTTTQDYWYRYDALNRMVTSKGALSGGVISRGSTGIDTTYNADGTRAFTLQGSNWREDYVYDAAGRIIQVKGGTSLSSAGILRGAFSYDALGRTLTQTDYIATSGYLGSGAVLSRTMTYNSKNQLLTEDRYEHRNDDIYRYLSNYAYGAIVLNGDGSVNAASSTYALGAALQVDTQQWKDGAGWPTTRTINAYVWYDGAVASTVQYDGDINNANNAIWTTTYTNDVIGGDARVERAVIADGAPRTVRFMSDMLGQGIRREQKGVTNTAEVWYRLSGRQMGYVGHSVNSNVNYNQSVYDRTFGASPAGNADFDLAYDHITTFDQGSMGGTYTVHAGDTLSSIASSLWGDSSLWYKIAEANGLTGDDALSEGAQLLIPVGVQRNQNNATTFKPYDPLEVLGNTSPTQASPPKAGGCGAIGTLIVAVIAVVVVAIIAPHAIAAVANAIPGGATVQAAAVAKAMAAGVSLSTAGVGATSAAIGGGIAAAAGSIVSQGVGVATGIQEKFSWNAVGMAAVASVLGGAGNLGVGGQEWGSLAARSMVANAITQGIGVATGMQKEFSWAGVATAGVGVAVRANFNVASPFNIVNSGAQLIADAATRSLIEGSDFGDNIIAALPNVLGQTIGEMVAGGIAGRGAPMSEAELRRAAFERGIARGSADLPSDAFIVGDNGNTGGGRSWWDKARDWLGFDGHFGTDGTTDGAFTWRGLGHAFQYAWNHSEVTVTYNDEEIVVTGERASRWGRDAITSIGPVTNSLIQEHVTAPIMTATGYVNHAIRHPDHIPVLLQDGARWINDHQTEILTGFGYAVAWEAAAPEIMGGVIAGWGGRSVSDDIGAVAGSRRAPAGGAVVDDYAAMVSADARLNWGTGRLQRPFGVVGPGENILLRSEQGLQSRLPGSGLFDDVLVGAHPNDATKYLFTVDQRGINIALEQTPMSTRRGFIVHSNLSSEASIGGEVWFGANNTVTINAGSGRFGFRTGANQAPGGVTQSQYDATIRAWESLGYEVNAVPLGRR